MKSTRSNRSKKGGAKSRKGAIRREKSSSKESDGDLPSSSNPVSTTALVAIRGPPATTEQTDEMVAALSVMKSTWTDNDAPRLIVRQDRLAVVLELLENARRWKGPTAEISMVLITLFRRALRFSGPALAQVNRSLSS